MAAGEQVSAFDQHSDIQPWLVKVSHGTADAPVTIGAGTYLGNRQILTCAHNVVSDDELPQELPSCTVYVSFEFSEENDLIPATPIAWFGDDDVAILQLAANAPASAMAAPFCSALATRGHQAIMRGYPRDHDDDATAANAVMVAHKGPAELQLSATSTVGFEAEPGFSGAAVYDLEEKGVIGMLGWREGSRPYGVANIRTAYATASDRLAQLWPPLVGSLAMPSQRQRRDRIRKLVEFTGPEGGLPRVKDLDIYDLGVARSKYPSGGDGYVSRLVVDDALAAGLRDKGFVVADGPSKAGKSRAMIQMLMRERQEARLLVPLREPGVLAELAELDLAAEYGADRIVVWLDRLETYLGPQGLTRGVLRTFLSSRPRIEVAAIITSQQRARLEERQDQAARLSGVLYEAVTVRVDPALTSAEVEQAHQLYPGEIFSERGFGAQLASAPDLEKRFLDAWNDAPQGGAVVQAAIDWQRMGIDAPVSVRWLRVLYDVYAEEAMPADFDDDEAAFASGLDWAKHRLEGRAALLMRERLAATNGFRAFDTLVDLADRVIPERAWEVLLGDDPALGSENLLGVIMAADSAETAWQAAKLAAGRTDSPITRAWASLFLGWIASANGDATAAGRYLAEVAESAAPEAAGWAKIDLAMLKFNEDELEEAESLLRSVIDDGDPGVHELATASLGAVLSRLNRTDEAFELLKSVAERTDAPQAASLASEQIGRMIVREAADQRLKARSLSFPGGEGRSLRMFDSIREQRGMLAQPLAQNNLGWLFLSRGDFEQARPYLEAALNATDPAVIASTKAALGRLLVNEDQWDEGKRLLREAHDGGSFDAGLTLAEIAHRDHDVDGALAMLNEIAERGGLVYGSAAADMIGDIQITEGDRSAARQAYRRAIALGQRDWSVIAAIDLARTFSDGDAAEHGEARSLLEGAVASAHPVQAPRAADLLGDLLADQGDFEAARDAYRTAVEAGDTYWSYVARVDLAQLLADRFDDEEGALELLRSAAESKNHQVSGTAHLKLGIIAGDREDLVEAEREFTAATGSGDAQIETLTQFCLTILTARRAAVTEAAGHADKMSTALTEWFDLPKPEPAGSAPEDVYLAAVDQLYNCASPDEAVALLEALIDNSAGLVSAAAIVAAQARLGRARYNEHNYQEAEALLRPSLAESLATGPSQWQTEALSRFFLGSTLVRVERFDEAREVLQPLVDSGDQEYLASTLLLLGLMGRVEFGQLFVESKLPEARDRLTKAAEALRQAKVEAARTDDKDVLFEAAQELQKLDGLLRSIRQRPELTTMPGLGDAKSGTQASRAIKAQTTTPQPATAAEATAVASPSVEAEAAEPVLARTEPGEAPMPAASPSLPASVLAVLGEIAGAEGYPAEAEYWFDRAEAVADRDAELAERIQVGRAIVWLDEGHIAQALAILDRIAHGQGRWAAAAADAMSAQG